MPILVILSLRFALAGPVLIPLLATQRTEVYISPQSQWGAKMGTIASVAQHEKPHDPERLKTELAWYPLTTISGPVELSEATWDAILSTDGSRIRRDVWLDDIAW